MKIFDMHVHCFNMPNNIKVLYETADQMGFEKINVMAAPPYFGITQNIQVMYCKAYEPLRTYCFGGLEYETGRSFLEQAKILHSMGADGFKSIEGKPGIRKELGIALDDAVYDDFYNYLAEQKLPILMHIADPPEFWDYDKMPQWAKDSNSFYDESFVSYAQFYDEVEGLLKKHPKLNVILAHFYFLSNDMPKAEYILETYPNVVFDLTAGTEMYTNFSKDIAGWRKFFEKYQDRILFGTDSTDDNSEEGTRNRDIINNMEVKFLQTDEKIEAWDLDIKGLGLNKAVQQKIFYDNVHRLVKPKPTALNFPVVYKEIDYLIDFCEKHKRDADVETLNILKQKISALK